MLPCPSGSWTTSTPGTGESRRTRCGSLLGPMRPACQPRPTSCSSGTISPSTNSCGRNSTAQRNQELLEVFGLHLIDVIERESSPAPRPERRQSRRRGCDGRVAILVDQLFEPCGRSSPATRPMLRPPSTAVASSWSWRMSASEYRRWPPVASGWRHNTVATLPGTEDRGRKSRPLRDDADWMARLS